MLPDLYKPFIAGLPHIHAGNRAAHDVLSKLRLGGGFVHIWGEPGNGKSHLALAHEARLIAEHAVGVRWLNERQLEAAAWR